MYCRCTELDYIVYVLQVYRAGLYCLVLQVYIARLYSWCTKLYNIVHVLQVYRAGLYCSCTAGVQSWIILFMYCRCTELDWYFKINCKHEGWDIFSKVIHFSESRDFSKILGFFKVISILPNIVSPEGSWRRIQRPSID